jgi:hypothetical protein
MSYLNFGCNPAPIRLTERTGALATASRDANDPSASGGLT